MNLSSNHTPQASEPYSVVLDSGAKSSLFNTPRIFTKERHLIRPLNKDISSQEVSSWLVAIWLTIAVIVSVLSCTSASVLLNLTERLETGMIVCNAHLSAIYLSIQIFEFSNGVTLTVINKLPKRLLCMATFRKNTGLLPKRPHLRQNNYQ